MRRIKLLMVALLCGVGASLHAQELPRHVTVFKAEGRFAGWPANNGAWAWQNELLVGFTLGQFRDNLFGHDIDGSAPEEPRFARSLDGGETWQIETPSFLDDSGQELQPRAPAGGIDFTHPDFAMTIRMTSSQRGLSRYYWSNNRGHDWEGPFALPDFGEIFVAARTDYIVNSARSLFAFITVAKQYGNEGRVICIETNDGGKTWRRRADIGPEPCIGFSIMPSTVRLGPQQLVSALRREGCISSWIDLYKSKDNGLSWQYAATPAPDMGGNPPSMLQLDDGRLVLTYGYRNAPYGIRARTSSDDGATWSEPIILRNDGGNWDLGYPRTLKRDDGKLVTVYYFNDNPDTERYIAATIWHPDGT